MEHPFGVSTGMTGVSTGIRGLHGDDDMRSYARCASPTSVVMPVAWVSPMEHIALTRHAPWKHCAHALCFQGGDTGLTTFIPTRAARHQTLHLIATWPSIRTDREGHTAV
jgi:hypothetical protein